LLSYHHIHLNKVVATAIYILPLSCWAPLPPCVLFADFFLSLIIFFFVCFSHNSTVSKGFQWALFNMFYFICFHLFRTFFQLHAKIFHISSLLFSCTFSRRKTCLLFFLISYFMIHFYSTFYFIFFTEKKRETLVVYSQEAEIFSSFPSFFSYFI